MHPINSDNNCLRLQILLEPSSLNPVSVTELRLRLVEMIGFDADVVVVDDDDADGGGTY